MAGPTIRVEGADELARTLNDLGRNADRVAAGFANVSRIIEAGSRSDAPKRTGHLAASVSAEPSASMASVYANARYAAPVIGGVPRRGMRGNPFMMRAVRRTEPAWTAAYDRALQGECDKVRGI